MALHCGTAGLFSIAPPSVYAILARLILKKRVLKRNVHISDIVCLRVRGSKLIRTMSANMLYLGIVPKNLRLE